MYSKASEKGSLDYNYSLFIKGIMFTSYALSLTNGYSSNKISKFVPKETFVEASKVVVKPSKVKNWHSFMH